ncbi:MAG: hypothetical protein ABEJ65_00225 [bacterium]
MKLKRILFCAMLIVVVGCGGNEQKKPDSEKALNPPENWEVYDKSDMAFRTAYPPQWKIDEEEPGKRVQFLRKGSGGESFLACSINASEDSKMSQDNLDKIAKGVIQRQRKKTSDIKIYRNGPAEVGNYQGHELVLSKPSKGEKRLRFIQRYLYSGTHFGILTCLTYESNYSRDASTIETYYDQFEWK